MFPKCDERVSVVQSSKAVIRISQGTSVSTSREDLLRFLKRCFHRGGCLASISSAMGILRVERDLLDLISLRDILFQFSIRAGNARGKRRPSCLVVYETSVPFS